MASKSELYTRCENNLMELNNCIESIHSDFMYEPEEVTDHVIKNCSQHDLNMFNKALNEMKYRIKYMMMKFNNAVKENPNA